MIQGYPLAKAFMKISEVKLTFSNDNLEDEFNVVFDKNRYLLS